MSYFPSSKQEFIINQQAEDEKYIMDALNNEIKELLKESDGEEEDFDESLPSQDNDVVDTNKLNVSAIE